MSDPHTLLPPSATALSRSLETVMAERTLGLETPIGTLWHVDTCPVDLLPWLAWAFSVEVWDHAWPEGIKRNVIRNAVKVHRLKGTRRSVELALEALNMRIDLHEGFELDEQGQAYGPAFTFTLDAFAEDVFSAGYQINAELHDLVARLIENVKPVRAHFTLRIGEAFTSHVGLGAGTRQHRVHKVSHDISLRPYLVKNPVKVRAGARMRQRHVERLAPERRALFEPVVRFRSSGPHYRNVTQAFAHHPEKDLFFSAHNYHTPEGEMTVVSVAPRERPNDPIGASAPLPLGHAQTLTHIEGDEWWLADRIEGALRVAQINVSRSGVNVKLGERYQLFPRDYKILTMASRTPDGLIVARAGGDIRVYEMEQLRRVIGTTTIARPLRRIRLQEKGPADWFQGIEVFAGHIYCLLGNSKIKAKKLQKYSFSGELVETVPMTALVPEAPYFGNKHEPEGLKVDRGRLWASIMLGRNGANRKRLVDLTQTLAKFTTQEGG